jgi:quercetin dioxygenase-like cupin family protein
METKTKLGNESLGMTMVFLNDETRPDDKSFDMEWEVFPNTDGPPIHIHPHAIETYEILEGEMEFYIDGQWLKARQGDKLVAEIGQAHTFRNKSNAIARVYNTHQPAMNFRGFFTGLHNFSQSGPVKNGKMTFKGILGISTLFTNYPKKIVSVNPPAFVMKVFSWLGKAVGINYK